MAPSPRRVLIADDDEAVRETLHDYLTVHGFEVVQAANGLEALLQLKRLQPDGVILDLNMPRLGGLETLRRIQAFAPSTRVIVYTGMLEPDIERQAIEGGATAVLSKSCGVADLKRVLETDVPAASPTPVNGAHASIAEPARRRLGILVVDDNPHVSDMLAEFVRMFDADTFPVSNAVDAVRLLTHGTPDAILLDIDMPGLSGLDALPTIRALAPHTKVVMISGTHDETTVKQALARGAFDYVAKPVDLEYLGRTLETLKTMMAEGL